MLEEEVEIIEKYTNWRVFSKDGEREMTTPKKMSPSQALDYFHKQDKKITAVIGKKTPKGHVITDIVWVNPDGVELPDEVEIPRSVNPLIEGEVLTYLHETYGHTCVDYWLENEDEI